MKKHLLLLFTALLPFLASAQTKVEIDGIWYNLNENALQAEVTKGDNKYSGSITIPAMVTHEGVQYSVASIGDGAFYECSSLTTITIPESVTSIGYAAFVRCSSLTAITIPESSRLTSIGNAAFQDCSSLTTITLPENVTSIGELAFSYCTSLTNVYYYAEAMPSTKSNAFYASYPKYATLHVSASAQSNVGIDGIWYNLDESTLQAEGTYKGENSWVYKEYSGSITIPDKVIYNDTEYSVTSIGSGAFWNCSSLTAITIPEGVTSIGSYAFPNRKNKGFEPHFNVGIAGSLSGYSSYHYGEMERKSSFAWGLSGEYHFTSYSGARLTYSGDLSSVGIDYMFDVSTLFAGYTSDRRLDVALAYGPMIGKQMVGCQIGLPIQFHMNKNWGISFEPRATLTNYYSDFRGSTSILIGVKYNFK